MEKKDPKIESKLYNWQVGNRDYKIKSRISEDKRYQLLITITDIITKEIHLVSKTSWKTLNDELDEIITGLKIHSENNRIIYKIYFDLYVKIGDSHRTMTDSPLFARFYTKHHHILEDENDTDLEFDEQHEAWLSCDNNMKIRMDIFYLTGIKNMYINHDYKIEEFYDEEKAGDDQFAKLKEACDDEDYDDVSRRIYKWAYKKIKTYHRDNHGKEIDKAIGNSPKVLIDLITNYLI